MKGIKSILVATAAAALAACAAETASAATTYPDALGPLLAPGIYTFGSIPLPTGGDGDNYAFYFTTLQPWDALIAMQAQNSGGRDPVEFELDEYNSKTLTWTQIAQSPDEIGAVLPALGGKLGPGAYRLLTDEIGIPTGVPGSLDGSITLSAVPEPATWAMMILGLGLIGLAARRRRDATAATA